MNHSETEGLVEDPFGTVILQLVIKKLIRARKSWVSDPVMHSVTSFK
jgi:hypothetical protein